MTIITTSGITGIDGIVPVYDPTARWCWWELSEIYIGGPGNNRYVPKVGDYVMDKDQYITYEVISIDPVTLISKFRIKTPPLNNGVFTEDDILTGVGPGTQSDTYRVYLDTGVTPHILAVDARLKIGGTMSSYAKIFKGSDVSSTGEVISRLYDQSGSMLTLNIPLELAAIDSHVNHTIKVVSVCYTNKELQDGEIVTVVIYNDVGHVVSKRQLLVENTSFIRSVNASQKYISHIGLESPFLSNSTDTLIELPINVPIIGLGLIGVVNYSDGSVLKLPIDGSKFKIFGLEQFVGTVVGQQINLVLSYTLSSGEITYGAVTTIGTSITKHYNLVSLLQNGSYAVKLFGFPVWVNPINGYTMKWFMYTLDRNVVYDVTQFVRYNTTNGPFKPKVYGFLQNLSVSINLNNVNGSFKNYIHVQTIDIVLVKPGVERTTNWTVGIDPLQSPPYGIDLYAKSLMINQNLWKVKIDSGISTKNEWLDRLYYNAKPLFNTQFELRPPAPNFFIIKTNNGSTEFPIDSWNLTLSLSHSANINDTIFIEFILKVGANEMKLVTSGLPIYEGLNL